MKTATAKDVHQEFNEVSKSLLQEATRIVGKANQKENALTLKLKELGFGNSVSIKDDAKIIESAQKTLSINILYPQNNFLTEEAIEKICKKYGLLMAKSTDFIGEIPVKNQMEIACFKLCEAHQKVNVIDRIEFNKNIKELKRIIKEDKNRKLDWTFLFFGIFEYSQILRLKRYKRVLSKKDFLKNDPNLSFRSEVKPDFMIVATPDNFNMANKEVIGEYLLVDEDPVVLCKVKNGYIQVSAWGKEVNMDEFKTATKN